MIILLSILHVRCNSIMKFKFVLSTIQLVDYWGMWNILTASEQASKVAVSLTHLFLLQSSWMNYIIVISRVQGMY